MKVKTMKMKRVIVAILTIVMVCVNNPMFQTKIYGREGLSYSATEGDVTWEAYVPYDTYNVGLRIKYFNTENAVLKLLTKEKVKELFADTNISIYVGRGEFYFAGGNGYSDAATQISSVSSLVIPEDYPIFPNKYTFTDYDDHDMFHNNSSIKDITVNTDGKNGFEIREATFYNMSGLQNVSIDVGDQAITLDGSVFANCKNLKTVTLRGKNINLVGSYNFAGCTNLKSIVIDGNLSIRGYQDFAKCNSLNNVQCNGDAALTVSNTFTTKETFSEAKDPQITFNGTVSMLSEQASEENHTGVATTLKNDNVVSTAKNTGVFVDCGNIGTISLKGSKNDLPSNFVISTTVKNPTVENPTGKDLTVKNFNIEGSSTLHAGAISNIAITNVSFNQETKVENNAFVSDKIDTMYFNTSEVTGQMGMKTSVSEIYYNNTDINKKEEKVTELANLSLDGVECENMYFFSPNFNYLKNVSYHNATKVFGYGGKIAKYEEDATKITSKDMFEKWVKKNGGTYENIVSFDESNLPKEKTLYVDKEGQSADLDLSSLTITAHYNPEVAEKDQFPTSVKSLIQASKYTLPYTTDADGDTNFSYKILQEVSSARVDSTTQYVYQGKNAKNEDATYVYCEDKNVSLQPGSYRYYVQAGGITWPLDVNVKVNAVERIEVQPKSGDVLHLTEGDNLDAKEVKERLIVTAYFANGEKQSELDQSQFEIRTQDYKAEVSKTDTSLIVSYKSQGEGIKAICNYNKFIVHENKVVSFEVNSDKDVMADGSTLELKDISVKNVKYENPEQTPIGNVEKGFHFVQNGVIKDNYQITKGENKIAVVYEDCTMNDALKITGIDNAVEDFEVFCPIDEVELYKKNTLNVSEISLRNVEYKDSRLKNEEIIEKGFTFTVNGKETDTVELQEGKNVIGVKYNGLDKYSAITIEGIPTTIDRIEAQYIGPAVYEGCEVSKDTKVLMVTVYHKHPDSMDLLLSNFDVSYGTYHIVPGEDNQIYVYYKGVKSANAIHVQGLADNVVEFKKVTYKGSGKAGTVVNKSDFYVELGYASGKTVNSEQNPEILNQLSVEEKALKNGENAIQLTYDGTLTETITVNGTQDGLVTATPVMSVTTPAITNLPEQTPPATDNVVATNVPTGTNVPMEVPTVPSSPGLKEPVKGSYYTVQGVKYKVTAVKGKSGTVEAVGYDKKASKVKVQTTVKINGYSFAVQKIGKNAFKNCTKIAGTISFAKNIKTIEDSAFSGCKNIKKVIFGTNVTQIGKNSFYKCKKLQTLQFQSGSVKKIGKAAFKGIAKKYTLKCPKALQKTYKKRLKKAL